MDYYDHYDDNVKDLPAYRRPQLSRRDRLARILYNIGQFIYTRCPTCGWPSRILGIRIGNHSGCIPF